MDKVDKMDKMDKMDKIYSRWPVRPVSAASLIITSGWPSWTTEPLCLWSARQLVLETLTEGFGNKGNSGLRKGFQPSREEEPVLQVGSNQPTDLSKGGDRGQQLLSERHYRVKSQLALPPHDGHGRVKSESHFTSGDDLLHSSHLLHQLLPR